MTAAVNATTQGIVAATAASVTTSMNANHLPLSPLKLLHLRMICGVATENGILSIWGEVGTAPNKKSGLAMLV